MEVTKILMMNSSRSYISNMKRIKWKSWIINSSKFDFKNTTYFKEYKGTSGHMILL